jgi:hypothetical protein
LPFEIRQETAMLDGAHLKFFSPARISTSNELSLGGRTQISFSL